MLFFASSSFLFKFCRIVSADGCGKFGRNIYGISRLVTARISMMLEMKGSVNVMQRRTETPENVDENIFNWIWIAIRPSAARVTALWTRVFLRKQSNRTRNFRCRKLRCYLKRFFIEMFCESLDASRTDMTMKSLRVSKYSCSSRSVCSVKISLP